MWYNVPSTYVDQRLPLLQDRPFWLHSMIPTHAQLLLRSGKQGKYSSRIDIVFKDVRALRVPRKIPTLFLRLANAAEKRQIDDEVPQNLIEGGAMYVIELTPKFAYIIADSAFMAFDSEPDPNPSPLLVADTGQGTWPDQIFRLLP